MFKYKLFNLLIILILLSGCSQTNKNDKALNRDEEIKTISKVIDSCISWAKDKDIKLFYSCIINDSTYLSVRPSGGVVHGVKSLKRSEEFWLNPDFQYVKHDISDLTIRLSNSGDVAWFYCILNDRNTWKGQPADWLDTRWTGVLEKEHDKWVIKQQHFSFVNK